MRVMARGKVQSVGGVTFRGYGSSCDDYPYVYLTAAAAVGGSAAEADEFCVRLGRCLREAEAKMGGRKGGSKPGGADGAERADGVEAGGRAEGREGLEGAGQGESSESKGTGEGAGGSSSRGS